MSEKMKNLLGDVLFLVIGVGMYIYASVVDYPIRSQGDVGSVFVPKLVCLLMIILSVLKIVLILINPRMSAKKETADNVNYVKGALVILVLAVYCIAFNKIGFLIMTPIMLFLEMSLMLPEEKRSRKRYLFIAAFSVISTAVIFAIFYYGLKLMLPAGILKELL